MIKISKNIKTHHFMIFRKWAFSGGSTKLTRAHVPPLFFAFFSKSYDPNIRKNTTFFNVQFVIEKFLRVFNVLKPSTKHGSNRGDALERFKASFLHLYFANHNL